MNIIPWLRHEIHPWSDGNLAMGLDTFHAIHVWTVIYVDPSRVKGTLTSRSHVYDTTLHDLYEESIQSTRVVLDFSQSRGCSRPNAGHKKAIRKIYSGGGFGSIDVS